MPIDVHIQIAVEEYLKGKGLKITKDLVPAPRAGGPSPEGWIVLYDERVSETSVRVTATISLTVEAVFGVTSIHDPGPKSKLRKGTEINNVVYLERK